MKLLANFLTVRTMTQFKVLKINERFVTQLAIFSNYFTKPNDFFESIFSIFVDSVLIIAIITSAGFVVNYSYDVQPVLAAAKIFVAASQCEGMFRGVKGKTKERNDLQYEIQRIVDEGKEEYCVFGTIMIRIQVDCLPNGYPVHCVPNDFAVAEFSVA